MSQKDYSIDYMGPMASIPCSQWEDIDSDTTANAKPDCLEVHLQKALAQ